MTKKEDLAFAVPPIVTTIGRHAKILALSLVHSESHLIDLREGDVIGHLRLTLKGGSRKHESLPRILCTFGLAAEPIAKGREDSPVATIQCEYLLQYEIEDTALLAKLTERDLEFFAAYNASLNAWPHAREFVQSMAGRMMLPPIVLPLFRPNELIPPPEKWQKLPGT